MGGHGHDRAGAVAHQHVVGDEHRHLLLVHRVDGVRPGEHAGLGLALGLAVELGPPAGLGLIRGYGRRGGGGSAGPLRRGAVGPGGCGEAGHQLVLGGQHHVGGAEQGVGPGGEHLDGAGRRREPHRRAGAAADPVALHLLDGVRPIQGVEVGQQPVGVGGDAHHPLLQGPPVHREVAAVGPTVGGDLLVGQHRSQARTPVHRGLVQVGQAVAVDHLALLRCRELGPGPPEPVGARVGLAGTGVELGLELGDGAGLPDIAGVGVVPGVVDLQEDPLGPAVVRLVGGRHAAAGIVSQAQPPQLPAHVGHVGLGRHPGVLAVLDRVLLGRQAEGVEAHRVQHVAAVHPLVAGVDVGADEAQRVADVQPAATGVREHVEHVELRPVGHPVEPVGQQTARVGRLERALGLPPGLPLELDLAGQRGVVPVLRLVGDRL